MQITEHYHHWKMLTELIHSHRMGQSVDMEEVRALAIDLKKDFPNYGYTLSLISKLDGFHWGEARM